jgi:hypothetical protein
VSSPGGVDGTVSAQTLNPCALLTTDDIQPLAGNASVGDGVSSSLQSVSYVNCRYTWGVGTAPAFSYLRPIEAGNESLVDQNSASWNHITSWLRRVEALREAA